MLHDVLDEVSLGDGEMRTFEVQGKRIVLAKVRGRLCAFEDACPHLGGSLGKGILREGSVVCPRHHWAFDPSTGHCLTGPPGERIATYGARAENGKILVEMP